MTIRMTLLALLTGSTLLAIAPAHAGGPVVLEETTETVAPDRDQNVLPFLIAGAVILAILAGSGGGGDNAPSAPPDDGGKPEPQPQPQPEPQPCVKQGDGGGC